MNQFIALLLLLAYATQSSSASTGAAAPTGAAASLASVTFTSLCGSDTSSAIQASSTVWASTGLTSSQITLNACGIGSQVPFVRLIMTNIDNGALVISTAIPAVCVAQTASGCITCTARDITFPLVTGIGFTSEVRAVTSGADYDNNFLARICM